MPKRFLFISLLALILLVGVAPTIAQEDFMPTFVPIGAGYPDTYPGFLEAALPYVLENEFERFYILMMPMAFAYRTDALPADELLENALAIERRRRQLENACEAIVPEGVWCDVVVPPFWIRDAALDEQALEYFTDDLGAVYFVGGDQTIAMNMISETPVESALADAYARGVVMGGNSAGLALLSKTMIGGYIGDFGPETGLAQGAVELWNTFESDGDTLARRGLSFGLENVILEQHFWERARISRLLNALAQPETPNIGVGVDSYTGVVIRNGETVSDVFGLYGAAVLDAETFGAADNSSFVSGVLSIRDVLIHLLAPGDYGYDLVNRAPSFADPLESVNVSHALSVPEGAGRLALWSGLVDKLLAGEVVLESAPPKLVIITGYTDEERVRELANFYMIADNTPSVILTPDSTADDLPDLSEYKTITVLAHDVTLIPLEALEPVREYWQNGGTLILDDAAALLAGVAYANEPPVPWDGDDDLAIEEAVQGSFINGAVEIANGWGMIDANIEVDVMYDYRFGRLFSLEYNVPVGTLGLSAGTMIQVSGDRAFVGNGGDNGVYALSFADADLMVGDNGGLVVANGVLDVFAPGEDLE